jgi:hypothetical protein
MFYIDKIVATFKERTNNKNITAEIFYLILGALLILLGILFCMLETKYQDQIIRSLSLTFT